MPTEISISNLAAVSSAKCSKRVFNKNVLHDSNNVFDNNLNSIKNVINHFYSFIG